VGAAEGKDSLSLDHSLRQDLSALTQGWRLLRLDALQKLDHSINVVIG
jgi:hypothetical protein